eukprot:jgi/Ulvmu1/8791/UM048_0046.1
MSSLGAALSFVLRVAMFAMAISQPTADFEDDIFDDERRSQQNDDFMKSHVPKKTLSGGFKLQPLQTYYPEAFFLLLLIAYAINFWRGRKVNDAIVLDWASQFCKTGTLFDRNFALVGPGYNDDAEELVMKNSHSEFQLWASGRRFCQGMLINVRLRSRHDLLALASYAINPCEDHLVIEVSMHAACMPPTVLAVAPAKQLRTLQKDCRDLDTYAATVNPATAGLRKWPELLHVLAESSAVFADLFPPEVTEPLFTSPLFYERGLHFRWLHFSSDYSREGGTAGRPVLRMCCALPERGCMAELDPLLEAMMAFIDIVGSYEMPAKAREKADRARAEVAKLQEKERRKQLEETVLKRKIARKEAEVEKVKRMTPAQRQKYEERQKRVELGRAMKKRTLKV